MLSHFRKGKAVMTFRAPMLTGLLVSVAMSAPAMAADYKIDSDTAHASIVFKVSHLGFSWIIGRFDKFFGTFSFDDKSPDSSKVKVDIDTTSVDTNFALRDKHLRGADLLDTDKYPTAAFESTSIKSSAQNKATVTGKLTLHGVTKDLVID